MRQKLARLPHELGPLGLASLLVLAALGIFHWLVLAPMQARNAELQERVARQAPAAQESGPESTQDKVAAVYEFLRKDQQTTDWLANALRHRRRYRRASCKSASYRTQPAEGPHRALRDRAAGRRQLSADPRVPQALARRDPGAVARPDQRSSAKPATTARCNAELRLTLHMVKS